MAVTTDYQQSQDRSTEETLTLGALVALPESGRRAFAGLPVSNEPITLGAFLELPAVVRDAMVSPRPNEGAERRPYSRTWVPTGSCKENNGLEKRPKENPWGDTRARAKLGAKTKLSAAMRDVGLPGKAGPREIEDPDEDLIYRAARTVVRFQEGNDAATFERTVRVLSDLEPNAPHDRFYLLREKTLDKVREITKRGGTPTRARCGNSQRWRDVAMCGPLAIGYSGDDLCVGESGHPTAIIFECGHRLCPDCARRTANKNYAVLRDRIGELMEQQGARVVDDEGIIAARKAMERAGRRLTMATFTQPDIPREPLDRAWERMKIALRLMTKTVAWKANASMSALKREVEWSTPSTRKKKITYHEQQIARANILLETASGKFRARMEKKKIKHRLAIHDLWLRSTGKMGVGLDSQWWHVHAHGIVDCGDPDQRTAGWVTSTTAIEMQEAWRRCVRKAWIKVYGNTDSFKEGSGTLHFRPPRTRNDGGDAWLSLIAETAKYVTKPLSIAGMPRFALRQLVTTLNGARVFSMTGRLYGLKLPEEDEPAQREEGVAITAKGEKVVFASSTGAAVPYDNITWRTDPEAKETWRMLNAELWDAQQRGLEPHPAPS